VCERAAIGQATVQILVSEDGRVRIRFHSHLYGTPAARPLQWGVHPVAALSLPASTVIDRALQCLGMVISVIDSKPLPALNYHP